MLYYDFQDYAGFKERFGIIRHDNGQKSRRNKILLAFIKQPQLLRDAVRTGDSTLINIPDMATLKQVVWEKIQLSGMNDLDLSYRVEVMDKVLYSRKYETDLMKGVCEDSDCRSIRYINHELSGRIYKKKAGRLLMELILETEYGQTLPEQVRLWICEEFCQDWETFTRGLLPQDTVLRVNKEFKKIYSSSDFDGSPGSCMMDRGLHSFYADAVDASAAYLENSEGKVIARCIIFNTVHDADEPEGKTWRLAERQYATDGSEILKRCLVDALVRGGHIDGYKKPGADCHALNAFVDINENSLGDKRFYVDCNLGGDDPLSWQDSFIYLDQDREDDDEESVYDSWHDEDIYDGDVVTVYYHGQEYTCAEDYLDEFEYVERIQEYHHHDDVFECPICHQFELKSAAVHSDLTRMDFCCEDCREKAENNYKAVNWTYSHYDHIYVESVTDIRVYNAWQEDTGAYVEQNILVDTLIREVLAGRMFYVAGQYSDRRAY